jgi:IS5 family transposase
MHAAMTHAMTRAMPPARAAPARRATTTTTTARRVLSARSAVRARERGDREPGRAREGGAGVDRRVEERRERGRGGRGGRGGGGDDDDV